jgi:hypothetical protein
MVNDSLCTYAGRREEMLVAYLYDEIDVETRTAFERHLATCARCRTELHGLGGVRAELGQWTTPDAAGQVARDRPWSVRRRGSAAAIRDLPVWTQATAAILLLGAAAGLANIRVSSTSEGFTIRTGWSRAADPTASAASAVSSASVSEERRAELAALEQRLRAALALLESSAVKPAEGNAGLLSRGEGRGDAATPQRVSAMIQASERRQQRELALRVAEVMRDVQAQRQADLVRIERSLGVIQSRTGMEVLRTQRQVNSLAQQVSQRP